ncbi:leucyl aminopeptidase [Myxococcus fulvus]|uniref:Probable cytosol aminopeptidase n=1 Tax=Myxococcus fulvus TaxID=33 RepID=A0A511TD04_MYXFU|nr:leucyl aminopeptidase [Myxococcus fulvus]GEN12037.1 putative cytosol aminopeptidase [Myxococcus fulvus]SEU36750.1 leucyl aminopeptidase [Myxococcus fulvus]
MADVQKRGPAGRSPVNTEGLKPDLVNPKGGIAGFNPTPSIERAGAVEVVVSEAVPAGTTCLGIAVGAEGPVPAELGVDRAMLSTLGFEGKEGQTLVLPGGDGKTVIVAVGLGEPAQVDAARLRDAAAAFARAVEPHPRIATTLASTAGLPPELAAQAVVEGVLLARYRYDALKKAPQRPALTRLALVAPTDRRDALLRGVERGRVFARAAQLARDLANTPPAHLSATRMAEVATTIAAHSGLDVEVFDGEQLAELGCGGILGVNRGSTEPPRMIKLTYRPKDAQGKPLKTTGRLSIIGKGVMYDSGGINLKPGDDMHVAMKLDMSGAAAVLASMSALAELGCKAVVTGYLMCTDNMPSGSAMKMGDVLTIRGGKTVEVQNTDAEGRLMLADGLVLAAEEQPDALITIATLTGAALRTFGTGTAGLLGNNQPLVDQVSAAAKKTDERAWQLPLDRRYRKELDSEVADMKNVGGANAGTITAALFLDEFVGNIPWAHLDICGPMKVDADESWRSKGATGFGTRLLIDLALGFSPPISRV